MKDTDWPKCFNYEHKNPFPKKHNCLNCRRCWRMPAGVITPGVWCTQYHYTDTPKCNTYCGGIKHMVGCEIERSANYNYRSGRYDDAPNPRMMYEATIYNDGCRPKYVPKKKIMRPIGRSKRFKILRGKILRPALKISTMAVHSRDLCKGCVSETGPFEGTPCNECQVVIHTRPTNYKTIKKVKKEKK